jgi:hypothetical protein
MIYSLYDLLCDEIFMVENDDLFVYEIFMDDDLL